jgi:hypothetical protein
MEMIMSTTKKAALGAVAALVAAMGTIGAAEAGFCKHRLLRSHLFVSSYDDCSLYKYKWLKTGKLFWQLKYLKCLGRSY